ncbi:MAG: PH domain-containing protein [Planctomycetaceae bacterium]|nr:PH domain-containing protein [Planctomycetaceae bacterium]
MSVGMAQPIAGVSTSRESELEAVYPSVAATLLGSIVGGFLGAASAVPLLPLRLLVMVVVGAAMAPLGLLAYGLQKVFGNVYAVTNRSVQVRKSLTKTQVQQVALSEIENIRIQTSGSYHFFRAGDLVLENAQGNDLLTIPGIPYPERLRQIIFDARDARLLADASLSTIQGRG